jgi:hypothetical protein
MSGVATMAKEEQNTLLLEMIEKITAANRERANALRQRVRGYLKPSDLFAL